MTDPLAELRDAARQLLDQGARPTPESLAAASGISRSTYFRLVGSHRRFLLELGIREPETSRARVLRAAARLIEDVGVSGMVMDTVAADAGTSRATLYRLFPTKADLIAALVQERALLVTLREVLEQNMEREPSVLLPPFLKTVAPRLLQMRGLLRAVLAEASMAGPDTAPSRAIFGQVFSALSAYLKAHMDAGRLRRMNPLTAAETLLAPLVFHAAIRPDTWVSGASSLPVNEVVEEMVGTWLRGMQPDST